PAVITTSMAGVDVRDLIEIKNSCCIFVSRLLKLWKYTGHSDEYKTKICLEFKNACKKVVNAVSNRLGVSVPSLNVTEAVPNLGPITFCDHYLFGLLKMMKGSGESDEDQRKIILELREECIDAVKRVVGKVEMDARNITVDMLEARDELSFLASNFASYFGTAEIVPYKYYVGTFTARFLL
ncbi:hypothetical protein A2U01_0011152, partial [Trifolium medium]|nr:hypothetical protein [Trifolium medium]